MHNYPQRIILLMTEGDWMEYEYAGDVNDPTDDSYRSIITGKVYHVSLIMQDA